MRRIAVLTGMVLAMAVAGGCGAGGRPATLAWFGKPRAARTVPEENGRLHSQLAERQRENAAAAAGTTEPARSNALAPRGDAPLADREGDSGGHDPATQALIERELQDAIPEERRELLAEFENIDPAMVRQLLRIRRMVRQVGHHAPDGGSRAGADAQLSGFEALAAAERPAVTPAVGHSRGQPPAPVTPAGAGLGGVDPWSRNEHGSRYAPVAMAAGTAPLVSPTHLSQGGPPVGPAPAAVAPTAPGIPVAGRGVPEEPVEAAPEALRSGTSAWARMVPRLDGLPNIFSGPSAPANTPAAAQASPSGDPPVPTEALSPEAVWQRDLEGLIARLEADAAQMPPPADPYDPAAEGYVEAHVYLRLLYLIAGRQEQAIAHIPGVDPGVQQFWQQMLWSMANYFDAGNMPDPGERATQTLLQLHTAARHLHEAARLKLGNVAFCTKITSFGNYDRFDPYEFSPGQPVLLYAEVENFRSEPTTDQEGQNAYRTVLRSKIDILSPSGEVRYEMEFPPTEDLCRAYRRDYFHSYEFTIPPRLPYGHHVLVLTVEDRVSQKLATYRLNFTVR